MEVNINKSIQFLLVIGKHEKQGEKGGISEYPILRIIRQHGVKPKHSCLSVKELIHRSLGQDYTAWKQKIKSKNASKLAW